MGILIFKSAKSYELDLKLDNANSGSLKVSTLNKPVSSRQRLKELVISGSSSTINILPFFCPGPLFPIFADDGITGSDEIILDLYSMIQNVSKPLCS